MATAHAQSPPREDRSQEINQLSDMVKNLLNAQEDLKVKLAAQEEQLKQTFHAPKRDEPESQPTTQTTSQRGVQRSKPKLNASKGRFGTNSASQKDQDKKTLAEQRRQEKQATE